MSISAVCHTCGRTFLMRQRGRRFCSRHCHGVSHRWRDEMFWSKVDRRSGYRAQWMRSDCWLWMACCDQRGYGMSRGKRAHRWSYAQHYGPIPKGGWILHRCGHRRCVRPTHLYLGTREDNGRDMVAHGRSQRGTRNRHARLTAAVVRRIRARYWNPRLRRGAHRAVVLTMAAHYGVTLKAIYAIVYRQIWRHLP